MPEPVTVWKVVLARGRAPVDVRGTLSLDDDALVFVDDREGATTRIRFSEVADAKRLRGSPVLMVRRSDPNEGAVAFYFAEPPPLKGPDPATAPLRESGPPSPFAALRKPTQRRQRRQNAGYLATYGRSLKPTLQAWAIEVRARVEASRGR